MRQDPVSVFYTTCVSALRPGKLKNQNLAYSSYIPAGNYMFKVNNRNTRTRCEICSKLTIKTPERR